MKVCLRCAAVAYCNEECQRRNWPIHKLECLQQKALVEMKGKRVCKDRNKATFAFFRDNYIGLTMEMRVLRNRERPPVDIQDVITFIEWPSNNADENPFLGNCHVLIKYSDFMQSKVRKTK